MTLDKTSQAITTFIERLEELERNAKPLEHDFDILNDPEERCKRCKMRAGQWVGNDCNSNEGAEYLDAIYKYAPQLLKALRAAVEGLETCVQVCGHDKYDPHCHCEPSREALAAISTLLS